eukprot:347293-Pleurochrysis_carterae.AAC.1
MPRVVVQHHKFLVMVCINVANLVCHSVYSVLAAFFPQEAKAKGMSEDAVGIIFASFAAVIFVCSPLAGRFMSKYGKVRAQGAAGRGAHGSGPADSDDGTQTEFRAYSSDGMHAQLLLGQAEGQHGRQCRNRFVRFRVPRLGVGTLAHASRE